MSDRIVIETANDEAPAFRPRPRLPLVIAAVAALLLVTGTMLGTGQGQNPPNSITVPIEPFQAPDGPWEERGFAGDGGFTDVAEGPGGLVAVGSGRRVDSVPYAWHSPDGTAWRAVAGPWAAGEVIAAVVATDSGFIAAGYRLGVETGSSLEAAVPRVWVSPDGMRFDSAEVTGLPEGGVIDELTTFDGTTYALGWVGPAVLEPLRPPGPDTEAKVWRSSDGATWSDVTPQVEEAWFTDIIVDETRLVLSGTTGDRAALWTSADGTGWDQHSAPRTDEQSEVAVTVTPSDDGYLALVRSKGDVEGLISLWAVRSNGFWEPIDPDGRPNAANWVAPVGRGLLAGLGFTRSVYPNGPELWASEDGVEWVGVEITGGLSPWPPAVITEVVDYRGRLLVFGSRGGVPTSWALAGSG